MNKKFILPLIVSASAAMFAAGCGTKTVVVQSAPDAKVYSSAQELAGVVKGNMNAVNYFTIEENFKIDAKISAYGQSSDMKMEGKGSGEMQMEPAYAHLNLDLSQNSSAGSASTLSESYISGTGAGARGYIKTDGGSWAKDSSFTGIEFDALLEQFMGNKFIESVSSGTTSADIDNNGGQVNGKDTYKISARVNGDIAGASFSDSLSSLQTVSADWSNLYADMELYIYKDSELPAKITVDGADFLKGIMDGMGIDCKVSEYTGEVIIDNYDDAATGSLAIPDSVILEAGDSLPTADTDSGQLSKKDSEAPATASEVTTETTTERVTETSTEDMTTATETAVAGIYLKPAIQDFRALTYGEYREKYNDTAEYGYGGFFWLTDFMVPELNVNASFYGSYDNENEQYTLPDDAVIIHVHGTMGDIFDGFNKTLNYEELLDSLSVSNGVQAYSDIGYTHGAASYYPVVIFDGDGDGNADDYLSFYSYTDKERADNVNSFTQVSLGKLPIKW